MGITHALLYALISGAIAAILAALRLPEAKGRGRSGSYTGAGGAAAIAGVLTFLLTWIGDWAFHIRPVTTFPGLIWVLIGDLIVVVIAVWIADLCAQSISVGTIVAPVAVIVLVIVWIAGHNGGHDAHKAAFGIVPVTEAQTDALPASTTSNMVIVTGDQAATRASQAMSSGIASTRNFSSYLDLGPAQLQMVDGRMWYVFPLEFQGQINKARLGSREPGYIMVSGEDPNASVVERYDGPYSMIVSLGGGQGSEPDRWAYDHGYSGYLLNDPTLEIADSGLPGIPAGAPFWTVTLLRPYLGWTFQAPAGVLLINASTGAIHEYNLPGRHLPNAVPSWVDRVYSQQMARQIANWYGFYGHAPFGGQGNSSRYQVSGDPVMVYTGDGNPSWRMLLTSFGNEVSTFRVVEMDSASGAMTIYRPASPMGIETSVSSAFCNAQGTGAGNVRANHLIPEGLTLHVIYGQLTWVTSYESSNAQAGQSAPDQQEGDTADPCGNGEAPVANPSFTGIGLMPAYHATAASAVFGSTKSGALASYLQLLATMGSSNGNAPGASAVTVTVTGMVAGIRTDVSGGTQVYYVSLAGANGKPDYTRVYTGTSSLGPALVEAGPGDKVTISVLKVNAGPGAEQMQAFSDITRPLQPAGA